MKPRERKKKFSLGRNARRRRAATRIAAKETRETAAKRELLREEEDSQERTMCGKENKKERVKCCRL